MTQDLLLALGAGLLAAVNPCGFALLPAYMSLLVLDDQVGGRAAAVRRALGVSAAMTVGFVGVFGVFGLIIAPLASGIQQYLPWVTLVLGLVVVGAGLWLLAGRSLAAFGWSPNGPRPARTFKAMVGFGATYALASLTCTIAPFLAIVISSFRAGSVAGGVVLFVASGVGMGLLVGIAAVAVALARSTVIDRLRGLSRIAARLTGGLLVLVGAYVAYYGWWELRVLAGADGDDPIIQAAARAQAAISGAVASVGVAGAVLVLAVLAGFVLLLRRRNARTPARKI